MREEFNTLIKFCGTRTVPAAETKSIGLQADALVPRFCSHQDYFILTRNFSAVYLDLLPSNSFTVTLGFATVYRDRQKTLHRDADGT
jgi:hypothetical protein